MDDPCTSFASIVEIQNQILGEQVGITGTDINLHYQSDRVPGYKSPYTLKINLSDSKLPENLIRIELNVIVAGRVFSYSFLPLPNQKTTFSWDGKDVYGRLLNGKQPVIVEIGYVYPATYNATAEELKAFSAYASAQIIGASRGDFVFWQTHKTSIGSFSSKSLGIGGWNIDKYHVYDPSEKVLYLGNGQRRTAGSLSYHVIQTIAGSSNFAGYSGDSSQADRAKLWEPRDLAIAPDGSIYIAESNRIRKVSANGIISTVAGDGQRCTPSTAPCGDGGSALIAQLSENLSIDFDAEGNLYIADFNNHRIRRVNSNGIISTIAGTGEYGYYGAYGDDSLAIYAKISNPGDIAVGPDGSIYLTDGNNVVRRIMPDGIITTVAGDGNTVYSCGEDPCGDGGPAILAKLPLSGGKIALGPDGSLYIATESNDRIRKVGTNGIITTVAGSGLACDPRTACGEGYLATKARLAAPKSIAVGQDGTLYICDNSGKIRFVSPDGIFNTLAGNGIEGFGGDNGIAKNAQIAMPSSIVNAPDGSIYVADTRNNRIRRIASAFPGGGAEEILVTSEDGSEVYIFTKTGKHLRTLHPLTGAMLHQFTYDNAGRLSKITDAQNNTTTIQRNADGNPLSITGPYGHVTKLEINSEGYLSSVSNPAGETHVFGYGSDGLLTRFTNPRGDSTTFLYDTLGRLIREDDAAGGFLTLNRTSTDSNYVVTHKSSLNRVTSYQMDKPRTGDQKRVNTFPSGLKTESSEGTDGSRSSIGPDGTKQEATISPDPRWGMLAPVTSTATLSTLGGLKSTFTSSRAATLTNSENPFTMTELRDTTNINGRIFTSVYNAASKTITQQSPLEKINRTVIDSLGRLTQTEIDGILPVNLTYDNHGRLDTITQGSGTDMRRTIFEYKNQGFLEKITNPLNQTVVFEHDIVGRIKKQTMPDGRVIVYDYDANGNLTSLTPPGKPAHTFSYSPIDQVTQYTPPDVVAGPDETKYTYNTDRELTEIIRPDGDTVKLDYSEGGSCNCGRLSAMTIRRGKIEYIYNDSTGNLEKINAPGGIGLSYDYDGALLTGKTWTGTISGKVNYAYDNDFRPVAISLNGKDTIAYHYDNDGLLAQAGALLLHRNKQNGLLTGSTLGHISDSMSYNDFGEVTGYKAMHGATTLYSVQFTRDKLGRIEQKIEMLAGTADTFRYKYDLAGRLTEVWKNGTRTDKYNYDDNGNRLSYTDANGTAVTGTYDNQDRLKQYGNAIYTYTANGELKSKVEGSDTTTYYYDEVGNLMAVTLPDGKHIEYLIDGQNRRIGKKVNGTLVQAILYENGLRPIAELNGNGAIISRFIYATHINVPDYMIKGGVAYRIITDHLGSPRLVVNMSTGQVAQRMVYDAFGNVVADSKPDFTPFGFAGGLYDGGARLVRFGARDYDAVIGRWLSKDPIKSSFNEPNLYVYAYNKPLNVVDPLGLRGFSIGLSIGGGLGAGGEASLAGYFGSEGIHTIGSIGGGFHIGVSAGISVTISYVEDLELVKSHGTEYGLDLPLCGGAVQQSNPDGNTWFKGEFPSASFSFGGGGLAARMYKTYTKVW